MPTRRRRRRPSRPQSVIRCSPDPRRIPVSAGCSRSRASTVVPANPLAHSDAPRLKFMKPPGKPANRYHLTAVAVDERESRALSVEGRAEQVIVGCPCARARRSQTRASQVGRLVCPRSPPADARIASLQQTKPQQGREHLAFGKSKVVVGFDNQNITSGSDDRRRVETRSRHTPSLLADLVVADLALDPDDLLGVIDADDRPASRTGARDQVRRIDVADLSCSRSARRAR